MCGYAGLAPAWRNLGRGVPVRHERPEMLVLAAMRHQVGQLHDLDKQRVRVRLVGQMVARGGGHQVAWKLPLAEQSPAHGGVIEPEGQPLGSKVPFAGAAVQPATGQVVVAKGLQQDQFGEGFATWNSLQIDYRKWAEAIPGVLALNGGDSPESLQSALEQAAEHPGLSLIHLPVYFGDNPLGGMGVYGRWNVGNWSDDVQKLRHQIGL